MNKERILRLADHMEKVSASQYLQSRWLDGDVTSREAVFKKVNHDTFRVTPKEGFCGTAACVLGHAALMPDMGVGIFADESCVAVNNGRRVAADFAVYGIDDQGSILKDRDGYELAGAGAGAVSLDIPKDDAEVMFSGGNHMTKAFYLGCRTYAELSAHRDGAGMFQEVITPAIVAATLRRYVETDGASMIDHDNFWG